MENHRTRKRSLGGCYRRGLITDDASSDLLFPDPVCFRHSKHLARLFGKHLVHTCVVRFELPRARVDAFPARIRVAHSFGLLSMLVQTREEGFTNGLACFGDAWKVRAHAQCWRCPIGRCVLRHLVFVCTETGVEVKIANQNTVQDSIDFDWLK
ncbi:hypothetical protein H257_09135 [Aphanomyces astaci]|uniref:Uncharacterized protein n=1 Tax=Aphanomyces astaci TaxID=112090 RepID=W4GC62_APHAT|nr:hypothetical protein H257_09135 [Aphanomyces astaci]ETV76644.1 hypothetical protein H257_09135 [Aphanomyces astaci]|eukprot:XP_009833556.1 hypothetical protein H257_09135 [Aphanomyces astaci]